MREKRNAYRNLVGFLKGKRPVGRPRHRWEDNIKMVKMDVREVGWSVLDWIYLAQDRDRWRSLVNVAWIFGFHKMLGNS
jgi:hypothetical protein